MNRFIQQFKEYVLHGMSLASILALMTTGCAPVPVVKGGQISSVRLAAMKSRELKLNATWRGQSYDALREVLGEPEMMVNNPDNPKALIMIYGEADDPSHCVDTFTVVREVKKGQWSVMDYFCR